jgi:hypothetical protein
MYLILDESLASYTVKEMVKDAPEHRVFPVVITFYIEPKALNETHSADCTIEGAVILWHHNTFKCIGDMAAIALWLQEQGIEEVFDYQVSRIQ